MGVEWRTYNSGDETPQDAIVGGKESDGSVLYVARTHIVVDGQDDGVHPGKFGATTGRGILVGYAGKEHYEGKGEILCGDQNSVKWVDQNGPVKEISGATPVDGGKDGQGNPLWVCHVAIDDAIVPGKSGPDMNGGTAAYGGVERNDNMWYAVLCNA